MDQQRRTSYPPARSLATSLPRPRPAINLDPLEIRVAAANAAQERELRSLARAVEGIVRGRGRRGRPSRRASAA